MKPLSRPSFIGEHDTENVNGDDKRNHIHFRELKLFLNSE